MTTEIDALLARVKSKDELPSSRAGAIERLVLNFGESQQYIADQTKLAKSTISQLRSFVGLVSRAKELADERKLNQDAFAELARCANQERVLALAIHDTENRDSKPFIRQKGAKTRRPPQGCVTIKETKNARTLADGG